MIWIRSATAVFCMLGILLAPLPVEAALFGEFGLQEEMKMGREFEVLVKSSMPLIEDPEIQNYVQDIVDRIVETLPPQPYKFPAHVILHDSLNAFAAPGGFVFVFSGLMMQLHHESELAGVLSHEIAHVSQRHIASRMERGRVISLASLVGMIAGVAAGVAGGGNAGGAAIVGSMAAGSSAMLNYSRIDEDDADRFGMQYLVAAGYNPNGLGGAFEVLKAQDWSGSSSMPAYLSTHPDLNMRLSSIRADIQTMPEKWLSRKNDDERFRRIQTLLWARHGDPRAAVQFFDKLGKRSALSFMGKAMLAARQNRTKEAEILFAEALQASSQDALVLREAGIFEYSKGDMGKARRYLEQALKKTPRDYYALFYYARILDDSGDHTGAQERYREVLRYVPEDAEVHTYYGKSLGAAKRLSAGYLHLAYAALYSGQERRAAGWLDKAKKSARTDEDSRAVKRYEEKSKERARIMKEAR